MEGTMAVITPVAYDFTPRNWLQCNGQLLSISTNSALFSLLGTTYGGNGVQTFQLPDLRGRSAVGAGTSTLGTTYDLGQVGGSPTATLLTNNMPPHNHNGPINLSLGASNTTGYDTIAENNNIAGGIPNSFSPNNNTPMAKPLTLQGSIGSAGGSQPFSILSPSLSLNYLICTQGIYPSRN
ncbi:tail fiber protein [Flavobacterium sp.]|uniref:phage tail protein n=1 Tax=Flavobacterium sp. TaxID=239 RepID=UPI00286D7024|nr:tail fiber protein [Flavobacterium sp.]